MECFKRITKKNHYTGFDVLVIGGGPAGFAASIASARRGMKTLLIEQNGYPGGIATASLCPHLLGFSHDHKQLVGGIADELVRSLDAVGYAALNFGDRYEYPVGSKKIDAGIITTKYALQHIMNVMLENESVTTLFYTSLIAVNRTGDSIDSVMVNCREGIYEISAKYYIDATGDAVLVHRAGGETVLHSDEESMTKTLIMNMDGVSRFVKSEMKNRLSELASQNDVPVSGQDNFMGFAYPMCPGKVLINYTMTSGDAETSESLTRMDKELRAQAIEGAQWFKKRFPGFENAYLSDVADSVGVRALRSIVGIATVREKDILAGTSVEEPAVFSKCYFGDHYISKFNAPWGRSLGIRGVPFKALIPKTLKNVIAAGRNISSEPRVITTFRLIATSMGIGEVAGITVCMAEKNNSPTRDVSYQSIRREIVSSGVIPSEFAS